jgi:nucleoside-diphosphate-sugar epimerase
VRYVVAGTGYTGRRVLEALPHGTALGLNRSASATLGQHEILTVDLDREIALEASLPTPYSLLYTVPPAEKRKDVRLELLLSWLEPAPQRLVYLSTSGVYGDRGGKRTDETVPVNPQTERARRRAGAEAMLERWCGSKACQLTILRVPGIYGPHRLGVERLRAGAPILREKDANPGNRIHVDDLVSACCAALQPEAAAGIYNVGDNDHKSATWFAKTVAGLAGITMPTEISRAEAQKAFSAQRLSFLAESRRLDSGRLRAVLGVRPRDPASGIKDSLMEESG